MNKLKKMSGALSENIHYLIFAVFAACQALILCNVVLFGDDYYYATFFYKDFGYFISENVRHYLEVNGRAFVHLLDELLLANGTILLWRIFAAIVIPLIVWFSALIASGAWKTGIRTRRFRISLVILTACFSAIQTGTANQTLYWATGFMNYVFPLLTTLVLFYYVEKSLYTGKFSAWLIPLAFFACTTTEQNAFASFCIVLLAVVRLLAEKKKPGVKLILISVFALCGIILLFAAPGNALRTTYYPEYYAMPLIKRLLSGGKRLVPLLFGRDAALPALMLFFTAFSCASLKWFGGAKRIFFLLSNGAAALLSAISFRGLFDMARFYPGIAFIILVCIPDAIVLLMLFVRKKQLVPVFFTAMAAGLQAAMLISPEMGPRTVVCSIVFIAIPTAYLIAESSALPASENSAAPAEADPVMPVISLLVFAAVLGLTIHAGYLVAGVTLLLLALAAAGLCRPSLRFAAVLCGLLAVCALQTDLLKSCYSGYAENKAVHDSNDKIIAEYLANDTEGTLYLQYLPNTLCKYTMPYDSKYHLYWFKVVNRLRETTEIVFVM